MKNKEGDRTLSEVTNQLIKYLRYNHLGEKEARQLTVRLLYFSSTGLPERHEALYKEEVKEYDEFWKFVRTTHLRRKKLEDAQFHFRSIIENQLLSVTFLSRNGNERKSYSFSNHLVLEIVEAMIVKLNKDSIKYLRPKSGKTVIALPTKKYKVSGAHKEITKSFKDSGKSEQELRGITSDVMDILRALNEVKTKAKDPNGVKSAHAGRLRTYLD